MSSITAPTISHAIDHVHLYTKDRAATAAWYKEKLGFEQASDFAVWEDDPNGPLTISNREETIHLALFERSDPKPFSLAFGVTGAEYQNWKAHLKEVGISFVEKDHILSWSIYFNDPAGNQLEITTYDYAEVTQAQRTSV